MPYKKQNFEDGKVLTAQQLNYMEDGIAAAGVTPVDGQTFDDWVGHSDLITGAIYLLTGDALYESVRKGDLVQATSGEGYKYIINIPTTGIVEARVG